MAAARVPGDRGTAYTLVHRVDIRTEQGWVLGSKNHRGDRSYRQGLWELLHDKRRYKYRHDSELAVVGAGYLASNTRPAVIYGAAGGGGNLL